MSKKLAVVIPVFNEERNIEVLFQRLQDAFAPLPYVLEVIFVNDGSADASLEKIKFLRDKNPLVHYIDFSRNFGHQVAISAGLEHTRADAVVIMDADLQDPPELIPELIRKWEEGYEVVYAQRRVRKGESWFKSLTAKIFYRLLKKITHTPIPMDTGDFRLMDEKVVRALCAMPERNRFLRGMVAWTGYRQVAVNYDRDKRLHGKTNYTLGKMIRLAWDGITSFSYFPLRISTWLGFVMCIVSFIAILWVLYERFFTFKTIQGWSSIMLAVLFLGCVQLLCLGIIGEYIARMGGDVKQRPLYLIRETTVPPSVS